MMSDEELQTIRARAEAATHAPWRVETSETYEGDIHLSVRTQEALADQPWSPRYIAWLTGTVYDVNATMPRRAVCPTCGHFIANHRCVQLGVDMRADDETQADATFIAHARQDIPALLSEVDRLRDEARILTREHCRAMDERDAARTENVAVRAIVEAMARYHQGYEYGCFWCHKTMPHNSGPGDGIPDPHAVDCPVTKARALLAQQSQEIEAEQEDQR